LGIERKQKTKWKYRQNAVGIGEILEPKSRRKTKKRLRGGEKERGGETRKKSRKKEGGRFEANKRRGEKYIELGTFKRKLGFQ